MLQCYAYVRFSLGIGLWVEMGEYILFTHTVRYGDGASSSSSMLVMTKRNSVAVYCTVVMTRKKTSTNLYMQVYVSAYVYGTR